MSDCDHTVIAQQIGRPGKKVIGTLTNMAASRGESWPVRSDSPRRTFDEWLNEQVGGVPVQDVARNAYNFSAQYHNATLRRVGWLDQKGRVWTEVPSTLDFDGGSLTPLLIDTRED